VRDRLNVSDGPLPGGGGRLQPVRRPAGSEVWRDGRDHGRGSHWRGGGSREPFARDW